MTRPVVVLDACALVPIRLATALLWLAEAGFFEPLWSDEILEEVERTLRTKLDLPPAKAGHRVQVMRQAFDAEALVDSFEDLIDQMECDEKDRHVLAAAVHAEADSLVTFNLKDFPSAAAEKHGVRIVHPDTFMTGLLSSDPDAVVAVLQREVASMKAPPLDLSTFLASMTSTVPIFANLAADAWRHPVGQVSDTPALEVLDGESAFEAVGGRSGDLTNPAQVAMGWWSGLLGNLDLARALTFDPSAWGDYIWAVDMLAGRALTSKVIPAVDAPDRLVFMHFVQEVAGTARVFEGYRTSARYLTLVRIDDGTWRAWGLGPAILSARDILGSP